jgi:hypothetical protein
MRLEFQLDYKLDQREHHHQYGGGDAKHLGDVVHQQLLGDVGADLARCGGQG